MRYRTLILSAVTFALAQERAVAAEAARATLETVTVTASRISREGYEAPTPTTVLDADSLQLRAASTLTNALAHVPQMRNTSNEGTASLQFGQSAGRGFVNLRGLGSNRTLVLFDGARPVSNSLSGDRDVLALPSALISRIDVVTGGTSASYGSDAVAGVVNVVVDSQFTGFTTELEGGTSSHSDATTGKFSAAWGGDLSERWHLIASAEIFDRDGLSAGSRAFATPSATVSNASYTPTNGERPLRLVRNAYDANQAPGGLILTGPLAGRQFLANGATAPYVPASCSVNQPYILCDSRMDLAATLGTVALTSPQRRLAGFGRLTFRGSSTFEAHFDALLSRTQTSITSLPLETSTFGLQLPIDVAENAFLPDAVRTQYLAAGEGTFLIGRQNTDEGIFADEFRESVASFRTGFRSQLGDVWILKGNASYGESDTGERWVNAYSISRFLYAVDSVVVNGQPTCRINAITVTDPACVPANIFGTDNMSAAAKAYFLGTIHKPLKTYQREFSLDLTGEPLSLWAGPLSIAAGASYREERTRQFNDGANRGFAFMGYPAFSGDVDVKETYAQAVLPLARDLPFAKSIEAELAARWVDYSQTGAEWPWKLGLNWTPISGVRFRASASQDIRAPNVLETNLPQFLSSISPQVNPLPNGIPLFNSLGFAPGQTLNVREVGGGNPALDPEISRTTSFGIVVQPSQALTASLDHYRIKITDAITTLPASTIVQECAAGDANQCELIGSADPTLPTVATISLNAQSFVTSGLDAEVSYSFPIVGGEATIRALANYVLEYEQKLKGAASQDLRGDISLGLPKLQGDLSVRFSRGATTAVLYGVYIGDGSYSKDLSSDLQNDHVPHVWYVDASVDRQLSSLCANCSIYASVANVFDEQPPHPAYGIFTNTSSFFVGVPYDRVGRFFKLGLRVTL